MEKTVSALIPFYGDPDTAVALVDRLAAQSSPPLEVIVIDDASPTPFPDMPGVRVVRRSINGGFGAAVNSGARAATGDLLLVLNSDLILGQRAVEDLVSSAEPWQPTVVSPLLREGGRLTSTARHWPSIRGAFFSWLIPLARVRDRRIWRRLVGHWDLSRLGACSRVDWVVGACLLIPRDSFLNVEGFDKRFHMNSEEVDLQRRLLDVGVPARVVKAVEVGHLGGGSSDPALRRQWLVSGMFIYFRKWGGARRLLLALGVASVINLAWNSARRVRNAAVAPLHVFREELALLTTGFRNRHGSNSRGAP